MDVFVEIDYMEGYRPPNDSLAMVREADAPVENPDGSTGIELHLRVNDSIDVSTKTNAETRDALMETHFDHENEGWHYAISVRDVRRDGECLAASGYDNGQFAFQTTYDGEAAYSVEDVAYVFMHELGHSVGLASETYTGIDREAIPFSKYAS